MAYSQRSVGSSAALMGENRWSLRALTNASVCDIYMIKNAASHLIKA